MSLKETYNELQLKSDELKKELDLIDQQMIDLQKQIHLIELNPHFLETEVEPLYELLWKSQMDYKKHQTELNTLSLQLQQFTHVLSELTHCVSK